MLWKISMGCAALFLGLLSMYEVDEDILIVEKTAALPVNRIKAFQSISDLKHYHQWYPGIEELQETDNSNMDIGKLFMEVEEYPVYGRADYSYVVIGYESPRYISFIVNCWILPRYEFIIERRDQDNRPAGVKPHPSAVTIRMHSRLRSYFAKYALAPVANLYYSYRIRQALLSLKYSFE